MRGRRPSPLDDSGAKRRPEASRARRRLISGGARRLRPLTLIWARSLPRDLEPVRYLRFRHQNADVAELVDAHGSGPCGCKSVEVRVLSSASSKGAANRDLFVWLRAARDRVPA